MLNGSMIRGMVPSGGGQQVAVLIDTIPHVVCIEAGFIQKCLKNRQKAPSELRPCRREALSRLKRSRFLLCCWWRYDEYDYVKEAY